MRLLETRGNESILGMRVATASLALVVFGLCWGCATGGGGRASNGAHADGGPATVRIFSPDRITKEVPPRTGLVLTMMKEGWPHAFTRGRMYEFTLANPMSGVAIVENISVEVLDVIEDRYPTEEATLPDFKYRLTLQPDFRGRYKFAEGFKYPSGDADKFTVLLTSSQEGYDYFFRFVVVWHDPLAQQKRELYSEVLYALYPELKGIFYEKYDKSVKELAKRGHEEHMAKVRARQAEISAKLKKAASEK